MKALKLLWKLFCSDRLWMLGLLAIIVWKSVVLVGEALPGFTVEATDVAVALALIGAVALISFWAGRESRDWLVRNLTDANVDWIDRYMVERERNRLMIDDVLMAAAHGLPVKSLSCIHGGVPAPEAEHWQV
jgi:hypothetical protein